MNFRFPQFSQIPVESIVTNISPDGLQLLKDMLQWNPAKRPTAVQSLKYTYFQNANFVPQQPSEKTGNVKTAPSMSEFKKPTQPYQSNIKTVPSYIGSPNVDNHSIQQLQLQIGNKTNSNQIRGNSDLMSAKSGISVKEQYLSRSRYIAGQNTKNSFYKNIGMIKPS